MLQIVNATPFAAARSVLLSPQGEHVWTVCVKATYRFDAAGQMWLADRQEPVHLHPVFAAVPGQSSMLRDAELVVEHPGTAITVNGTAYAPEQRPLRTLDVGLQVGPVQQTLRIVGDRHWMGRRLDAMRVSDPELFVSMPLCYERAFGGIDPHGGLAHRCNPVGRGFATTAKAADGLPLPNIEWPDRPLRRPDAADGPAGFGAIAPHWSPRKELAGTADEAWVRSRAPLWPEDWNAWYCNAAPPSLQTQAKLKGGELVSLTHLLPQAQVAFRLPRVFFDVRTQLDRGSVANTMELDRVIIEPDLLALALVWRMALPCGPDARRVSVTYIDTKRDVRTGRRDGLR